MKAVRIHSTGGPEVLQIENLELPEPAADEVRIRHTAMALTFKTSTPVLGNTLRHCPVALELRQ
jgi:NADPH:quinone reductase-like Zn-dependent oxidoreductase